jgi:hypothetical protein
VERPAPIDHAARSSGSCLSSHDRSTGFAGSTVSARATDSAFIGVVKSWSPVPPDPRSVENVVVKAACGSATMGRVVSAVVAG